MPVFVRHLVTVALMSMTLISASPAADGKPHRIAIQVDQNDPQLMNLALGNVSNVIEYYRDKDQDVEIDQHLVLAQIGEPHAATLACAGSLRATEAQ